MVKAGGIYQILNISNGKCYIGSAINIKRRWADHKKQLRRGNHHSRFLQRAWNKQPEEVFVFARLITCAPSMLLHYEQQFIDQWRPSYNMSLVAGSRLGVKATAATRAKLSVAHKGRKLPPEHRSRLVGVRKHSEETKKKMSETRTGHITSEETKAKIGAANSGRIRTPENRQAISQSLCGKVQSTESNLKRSRALTGVPKSLDAKANMRAAWERRLSNVYI